MKIINSFSKLKESRRKCVLCGCSPYSDNITLYRFPKPGPRNTVRCELWAKFVYPVQEWSSPEFQSKAYKEHRMVCEKHFTLKSFIDYSMKKLHRHAYPELRQAQVHDPLALTLSDLSLYLSTNTSCGANTRVVVPSNDALSGPQRAGSSSNEKDFETGHEHEKESDIECASREKPECISTYKESPHENIVPVAKIYSWQKRSEVVADQLEDEADNISMYCENEDSASLPDTMDNEEITHEGFRCNVCEETISGFRYTCVQCSDFDLCGVCETNREHRQHYMLRVPTPRPAAEVQAVLATVRRYLMKTLDPINELEKDWDDAISIKSEVKSEKEDDDYDDQKRSSGHETTSDQPFDEEVECGTMGSVESDGESRAVERVVSTECTERTEEIPTEIRYGEEAIQQQPAPHTTHKRKILIDNMQLLAMLNDCTSAKKITIPPIPNRTVNKHIPRILLKNKQLIKPHIKLKITKLPPGAIVKPVPKVQLEPPSGNTTEHNVDNR